MDMDDDTPDDLVNDEGSSNASENPSPEASPGKDNNDDTTSEPTSSSQPQSTTRKRITIAMAAAALLLTISLPLSRRSTMVTNRLQTKKKHPKQCKSLSSSLHKFYPNDEGNTMAQLASRLTNETLRDLSASSSSVLLPERPLVFDAGHGTTGTTTLFEVLCKLYIPTIHFKASCGIQADDNTTQEETEAGISHAWAKQPNHPWVQEIYRIFNVNPGNMQLCSNNFGDDGFCQLSAKQWLLPTLKELNAVIALGRVDALMDTPYAYFASYILHVAHHLRRNDNPLPPIILLSERNATEWTHNRATQHRYQVICQPAVTKQTAGNENDNKKTGKYDNNDDFYLDYGECYLEALRRKRNRDQSSDDDDDDVELRMYRMATLIQDLGEAKAFEWIAKAYDRHQLVMKCHADYTFNVFTHKPRLEVEGWRQEIAKHVPDLCHYWKCTSLDNTTRPHK